jgi:ATP-dependent RNA helicase MRH4
MELDIRPSSAVSKSSMTFDADANPALRTSGPTTRPVDVLVGTPMKLLEMLFGRGWDRDEKDQYDAAGKRWPRAKPEMGLANIEWVVVDEADVLFG